MPEQPKLNDAAKITYTLCTLLILGTIFALNGLWPMGRLSTREPGFDQFENLLPLAPLPLLIWWTFY